jgi:excisionase family DNA binding protein
MENLCRVKTAARILDCTTKNIYYLIRQGKIDAMRLGPRQTRITKSSIEKLIKESRIKSNEE